MIVRERKVCKMIVRGRRVCKMTVRGRRVCKMLVIYCCALMLKLAACSTVMPGTNTSAAVPEITQDFSAALNDSDATLQTTLLFRYPDLLLLIADIVNNNTGNGSLSEYELCQLVKTRLQSSEDTCTRPNASAVIRMKCKNTPSSTAAGNLTISNPQVLSLCQEINSTTPTTPQSTPTTPQSTPTTPQSAPTTPSTPQSTPMTPLSFTLNKPTADVANYPLIHGLDTRQRLHPPPLPNRNNQTNGDVIPTFRPVLEQNQPGNNRTDQMVTPSPADGKQSRNATTQLPTVTTRTLTPITRRPRPPPPLRHPTINPVPNVGVGSNTATNYFFLAIKVIAKTVMLSNERKCNARKGIFDQISNACRIPILPLPDVNGTLLQNASLLQNGTNFTVIFFAVSGSADKALRILNITGHCISLFVIALLFVEYFLLVNRFSLPDKNIMCLASSLFLSHALQLLVIFFGSSSRGICQVTGILLHWALLLAFLWMAAMSYDFFITFTRIRPISLDACNARFKKYLAAVTSTASIAVLACIIAAQGVGFYGIQGRCFVAEFYSNLFGFTIPVAVILLTNVVLMSLTIYKLRSLKKESKQILKSSSSQPSGKKKLRFSVLTLKLSVLFGLGWLFGFAAGFAKSNVLVFCFSIIVNFQGTILFLTFGSHQKTIRVFKRLLGRESNTRHAYSSAATQSTRV